MGQYVDVAVKLSRPQLEARFAIEALRDEETRAPAWRMGGMPVQFGRDVAVLTTVWGTGVTIQFVLAQVEKALPTLIDDLAFNDLAVTLETGDLPAHATFAAVAATGVTGADLLGTRGSVVADVLRGKPVEEPSTQDAADAWLDSVEFGDDGQLRKRSAASEQDLDAQAEAFLGSMDRAAILRALRAGGGDGD